MKSIQNCSVSCQGERENRCEAADPEQLADQLLLVSNGALASAPLFGTASPALQLKTIAAHLIDLQLELAEDASRRLVEKGEHG